MEEIIGVWDALLPENPFLNSKRHAAKNIRWRYQRRFPYRVIYEVIEHQETFIVAAVLHAARHEQLWKIPSMTKPSFDPLELFEFQGLEIEPYVAFLGP